MGLKIIKHTIFLLLLLKLQLHPSQQTPTQIQVTGNLFQFTLSYEYIGTNYDTVQITIGALTNSWVAIGFGATDMYSATVDVSLCLDENTVLDYYTVGKSIVKDIQQNLVWVSGSRVNGYLTCTFNRLAKSQDTIADQSINNGLNSIIFAIGHNPGVIEQHLVTHRGALTAYLYKPTQSNGSPRTFIATSLASLIILFLSLIAV